MTGRVGGVAAHNAALRFLTPTAGFAAESGNDKSKNHKFAPQKSPKAEYKPAPANILNWKEELTDLIAKANENSEKVDPQKLSEIAEEILRDEQKHHLDEDLLRQQAQFMQLTIRTQFHLNEISEKPVPNSGEDPEFSCQCDGDEVTIYGTAYSGFFADKNKSFGKEFINLWNGSFYTPGEAANVARGACENVLIEKLRSSIANAYKKVTGKDLQ